jgi:hypothetical protein
MTNGPATSKRALPGTLLGRHFLEMPALRLGYAPFLLEIMLEDQIIVGKAAWVSLRDKGLAFERE